MPGGFAADPDVFSATMTASLTPLIATRLDAAAGCSAAVFPMAVRPQGHYIIASWLFNSLLQGYFNDGEAPWRSVMLSGRLRPTEAAIAPMTLIERFGADGLRYWATSWKPGRDVTVDVSRVRRGRRLALALLNLDRRTRLMGLPSQQRQPEDTLDRLLSAATRRAVAQATVHFDMGRYDQALADAVQLLTFARRTFVPSANELARGESGGDSRTWYRPALRVTTDVLVRLFAPFLPFVAEECWSTTHLTSVHRAPWPTLDELR